MNYQFLRCNYCFALSAGTTRVVRLLLQNFALKSRRTAFGDGDQDWPGAYMFWWLYYTTADIGNYTERPLITWLQGGPGCPSTGYSNFTELNLDLKNIRFIVNQELDLATSILMTFHTQPYIH